MKKTIFKDEYNLQGGGLYAYFPFAKFDSNNRGMIKVGYAENFNSRGDGAVHHYFPEGVYYLAFFQVARSSTPKGSSYKTYLSQLEKEVFKILVELGAKRLKSTTRVRNDGETEWFYANPYLIKQAFDEISTKHKGEIVEPGNTLKNINENGNKDISSNRDKYEGKYIYFL